jgi:HEAT repeat protein
MNLTYRGTSMKLRCVISLVCAWTGVSHALADDASSAPQVVQYDRAKGELSPGTSAPTREGMMNAINNASPTRLYATLEYGERVECFECIPLLADKLISSDTPQVREISAWWLRRRPFGFAPIFVKMKQMVVSDADPQHRARAAEALGEFLDPHASDALTTAATQDSDVSVRVSAVKALGRLNVVTGQTAIAQALADTDVSVRQAALAQVLKVNSFQDLAALLGRLGDSDATVRRGAAQLAGELRLTAAVDPLLGLLMTDADPQVRQAAAIALGHLGGSDAQDALTDAKTSETDDAVRGAIEIAARMK